MRVWVRDELRHGQRRGGGAEEAVRTRAGAVNGTVYSEWGDDPPCLHSGTFVLANVVYNGLTTTHAFEIYANGELVFSKLATGRLPSPDEFWAGLTGALGRQPIAIHPAGMGQQQRQQRMHP